MARLGDLTTDRPRFEILSIPGIFKILRVSDWIYLLGIPLLAALRARVSPGDPAIGATFLFCAVYFSWGYAFNDLFDLEEDDEKRNALKAIGWRSGAAIVFGLQVLFAALAWSQGLFAASIGVICLNGLYSVRPFRWKRFLLPSLLSNGVFFAFPYYAAVRMLGGKVDGSAVSFTVFVFLLFQPLQYVHFLEHRELEGKANLFVQKVPLAVLLAVLCASACWIEPSVQLLPTLLYAAGCLAAAFLCSSAGGARKVVRHLSMAYGGWLAFVSVLGFYG